MPGFVLHCQPIVELATEQITQYELLPRVNGGDDRELDSWTARQAIHLVAEHDVRLEVHVSARSLRDATIPELVERELALTGIDPSRLVFAVTEKAAIAGLPRARAFAESLTGLGCRFALDNFGTGGASFYSLKHLPLAYLKIDGRLIGGLTSSVTDRHLVESLVDVARGMGMMTIAERVEAEETVTLLRAQGVDYSQGGFHGAPRPVAVEFAQPALTP